MCNFSTILHKTSNIELWSLYKNMYYDEDELIANRINLTPRVCVGGELGALWIVAYGKTPSTHIWDTFVSRSFSNTAEIEIIIETETARLAAKNEPHDRVSVIRKLILKSGLFRLRDSETPRTETIAINTDLAQQLKQRADSGGMTVEQLISTLV